jgi:hypothetical protein
MVNGRNLIVGGIIYPKDKVDECDYDSLSRLFNVVLEYERFLLLGVGDRKKIASRTASVFVENISGYARHHWSYKTENFMDVIYVKEHIQLHNHLRWVENELCFAYGNIILNTEELALDCLSDLGFHFLECEKIALPTIDPEQILKEWDHYYPHIHSVARRHKRFDDVIEAYKRGKK